MDPQPPPPPRQRVRAAWRWVRRAAVVLRDRLPLTPLGALITLASAFSLWSYGIARIDLLLLIVGGVGLGLVGIAALVTVAAALSLWLRYRKPPPRDPLRVECGAPTRTDFSFPSLWYLPLIGLRWRWTAPDGAVRAWVEAGRTREEVRAARRGTYDLVERELEVFDLVGLCLIRFRLREPRQARVMPSSGKLRHVDILQSTSRGEELPHPAGAPEGDRIDMKRYAPGDPIRFVMWKVFAKTRSLVVRVPEKALSPARQTAAYLVTGAADEPAAGALRAAVEAGSLGREWVVGADGVQGYARSQAEALELLAKSGTTPEADGGTGLRAFLQRAVPGGGARVVVFAPARPGPWVARAAEAVRAHGAASFEFLLCADGILQDERRTLWERLALLPPSADAAYTAPSAALREVLMALRAVGASALFVDRRRGQVARGSQLSALLH